MLLALAKTALPGERIQKEPMDAQVERAPAPATSPGVQDLVVRNAADEALQQRGVAAAKPAALRREPAVEGGAAVDLQAVEEIPGEQGGERSQPLRRERLGSSWAARATSIASTRAVRQIEPDGVRLGVDPAPPGLVDKAPDLAQAPTKLAARVVGRVPEQVAELAARHGVGCQRQVGEECPHLARRRHGQRYAVADDRQRPEEPHLQRGGATVSVGAPRFRARFHGRVHARLHGWWVRVGIEGPVRARRRTRPRLSLGETAERSRITAGRERSRRQPIETMRHGRSRSRLVPPPRVRRWPRSSAVATTTAFARRP